MRYIVHCTLYKSLLVLCRGNRLKGFLGFAPHSYSTAVVSWSTMESPLHQSCRSTIGKMPTLWIELCIPALLPAICSILLFIFVFWKRT